MFRELCKEMLLDCESQKSYYQKTQCERICGVKESLTLINLTEYYDARKLCLRVSIDFRMKYEYPYFQLAVEQYPLSCCDVLGNMYVRMSPPALVATST